MDELFIIQDDYFISDSGETICKIPFSLVFHYVTDGEFTIFFDEKKTERRIKLRLCKLIKQVKMPSIVRYSLFGAVNLDYYVDVLPLQAGRNKHDILLSNNVKLEIPVERLTPFRKAVNKYKLENYMRLMFRR